jgi:hypothetical protein
VFWNISSLVGRLTTQAEYAGALERARGGGADGVRGPTAAL